MIQVPVVVGLILCERVEVDPQTRKFSLSGVFQSRHFLQFPSPPVNLTVYTILTDGVGEGTMKLVLSRPDSDVDFLSSSRWFVFPADRSLPINVVFNVNSCVFPVPGEYAITLFFDNQYVAGRTLRVYPN